MAPFQPKNICLWFIQTARQFSLLNLALHGYMVIYIPALLWIAVGVIFHLGVLQTMLPGLLLCCCNPVSLVVLSGADVLEIGLWISHSYTHQRAVLLTPRPAAKAPFAQHSFPHLGLLLTCCTCHFISLQFQMNFHWLLKALLQFICLIGYLMMVRFRV